MWNASISSQNNPQSCHPYELMSPWGFTFWQNISEMKVDIYAKFLFRQDSFQIRALMTTDTSETSSVDKKFPELLKVSRGFRPILRPWPFLQTILMFDFRILASQYIWLWTEKYHKEGVNVSFWQFYSGFCAPSAFISSVRSSYSHPDLLVTQHQHQPLFRTTPVLNTGLSLSEPLQL